MWHTHELTIKSMQSRPLFSRSILFSQIVFTYNKLLSCCLISVSVKRTHPHTNMNILHSRKQDRTLALHALRRHYRRRRHCHVTAAWQYRARPSPWWRAALPARQSFWVWSSATRCWTSCLLSEAHNAVAVANDGRAMCPVYALQCCYIRLGHTEQIYAAVNVYIIRVATAPRNTEHVHVNLQPNLPATISADWYNLVRRTCQYIWAAHHERWSPEIKRRQNLVDHENTSHDLSKIRVKASKSNCENWHIPGLCIEKACCENLLVVKAKIKVCLPDLGGILQQNSKSYSVSSNKRMHKTKH